MEINNRNGVGMFHQSNSYNRLIKMFYQNQEININSCEVIYKSNLLTTRKENFQINVFIDSYYCDEKNKINLKLNESEELLLYPDYYLYQAKLIDVFFCNRLRRITSELGVYWDRVIWQDKLVFCVESFIENIYGNRIYGETLSYEEIQKILKHWLTDNEIYDLLHRKYLEVK